MTLNLPGIPNIFKRRSQNQDEGIQAKNREGAWSCTGAIFKNTSAVTASVAYLTGVATANANDWEPLYPVEGLPNGCTITKVTMFGNFVNNWYFRRVTLSTGAGVEICQGAAAGKVAAINIYGKVDNEKYAYFFVTDVIANTKKVYGCNITYTIN